MTKFFLITFLVLFAICAIEALVLFIQYRVFKAKIQKREEQIRQEFAHRIETAQEIINEANKQKQSIHTGTAEEQFNNSINALKKEKSK